MANKIAVVTGGAGGIGQAVVARLAQSGFGVCILDQNDKAGQEFVEQLRKDKYEAEFYRVELRRAAEIKEVFETVYAKQRCIDVLVNLAGGTLHKHPIHEFPLSEWREVIDVNLKATFLCCQAVSKRMKEAKSGAIINTSSNFGITGSAGRTAYSAAKAAAFSVTQALRGELALKGISVHAVLPGPIDTDMVRDFQMPKTSPDAVARAIIEGVEAGLEEILPDPAAREMFALWKRDPKALQAQLANL